MSAVSLRKPRTFLLLVLLSAFLGLALLPTCLATDVAVTMFGPKQYLRTTNPVDVYTDTFLGVAGPGTVILQNGDGNGNHLVEDLLITINGVPLADWSELMQPPYTLQVPITMDQNNSILVILLGKPGSYLSIQAEAEITPDATTTQVVGISGGTMSVENHLGDTFTVTIPPLALGEDTSISVSALPNVLPSPIANNVYPGAVLEPEGLFFLSPVTMAATFSGNPPNSNPPMLFWYEDSTDVLPIGNQTTTQNSVTGQNYHFSTEMAGVPTVSELLSTLQTIVNGPGSNIDKVQGVLTIAGDLQWLGDGSDAATAWSTAQTLATKAANAELNGPAPPDPCAQKVTASNLELAGELQRLDLGTLAEEIMGKDCALVLAPASLSLFIGQTSGQAITATLIDPKGKRRPCAPQWYDSNESVATLAESGNTSIPTGVGSGVATVSAICDGGSSIAPGSRSTEVNVCGLIGTYQGSYSGETTTHTGKPKHISGSLTIPFTQSGTSVSGVILGYNVAGTNIDGAVTLEGVGTPVPSGASGKLSSDCSSLSGSFYVNRRRRITGSFSVQLSPP